MAINTDNIRTQKEYVGDTLTVANLVVTASVSGAAVSDTAWTLSTEAGLIHSLTSNVLDLRTQVANKVLAGPTTGADAKPAFRLLVTADIPTTMTGKTLTTAVLNGTLGASTPAAAAVTTLSASGLITATGGVSGVLGATGPAAITGTTIVANTSLKVNATTGTALTQIIVVQDTIASGQVAKTVSAPGCTASSKVIVTANEIPTADFKWIVGAPGTDQVIVTVGADPSTSNLDITVMVIN